MLGPWDKSAVRVSVLFFRLFQIISVFTTTTLIFAYPCASHYLLQMWQMHNFITFGVSMLMLCPQYLYPDLSFGVILIVHLT